MNKKKFIARSDVRLLLGIAHRGLHNEEYTENGLKAFTHAIDNDVAFEFDIHLTKDKKLVVCHDSNLKRTTGEEGIIEEMSLEEIRKHHLLDGGVVPTLQEVIDLNNERVPMVIELKVENDNYKEIAAALKPYLSQFKDKKKIHLISFDPRSLTPFRNSGFLRVMLVAEEAFWTWKYHFLADAVDVEDVLLGKKQLQRYRKRHFVNCWTIETKEQFEKVYPYVDTVTFQHLNHLEVKKKMMEKIK